MTRLWDKGGKPDPLVHRFTVGDDPRLDLRLVHFDCLGSAAHARTLERAGLLTADEADRLVAELAQIDALAGEGRFAIPDELEDGHTAIESHLTAALGELGQKIHTGRSRNDQVATAMRLFMRQHALQWADAMPAVIAALAQRIRGDGATPMPGYTHMQPAMPSSVGLWLHAFAEALLEQLRAAGQLLAQIDCCPLGTGAGYGVPLPLDRGYTAALLGFSRVQRNPIDVQNSRGRMETYFVRVAADVAAVLEKLSSDLLLFSTAEFGFFSLPEALTTGSSIMPQKQNPDVLELIRAGAGRLRARQHELEWLVGKLPSGYHRDLQLTKGADDRGRRPGGGDAARHRARRRDLRGSTPTGWPRRCVPSCGPRTPRCSSRSKARRSARRTAGSPESCAAGSSCRLRRRSRRLRL